MRPPALPWPATAVLLVLIFPDLSEACVGLDALALAECRHREQAAARAAQERARSNAPREIGPPAAAETPCGLPPKPGDVGAWLGYGDCIKRETAARGGPAVIPAPPPPRASPPRGRSCIFEVWGPARGNRQWVEVCR